MDHVKPWRITGTTVSLLIKLQKQIMKMASDNRSMFPVFVIDDAHLMEKESLMDICYVIIFEIDSFVTP